MFAAPSFESDRENAAASLVNAILWMTIAGACVFEVFQLYANIDPVRIGAVGGVFALAVVALVSLRRGHLRAAAWLVASTLFGVACVSIWLGGSIRAPGTSTLLILIVMSAMALEWQLAAVWTLLSLAAVTVFAFAEMKGWLPPVAAPRAPLELWFIYVVHIAAAAWLVSHSAGAFRGVLGILGIRSTALVDSEERYAELVEHSPDVIVAIDGDGIVEECSPAIETLYGYAPDEIIGRRFLEMGVIPAESLEQNLGMFRSLLAGEQPQLAEVQVIHRDGSVRWAEANPRLVHRSDGTTRLHLVIRDITARVEAEQRRAALEQQLVEARRLEALGRMAGSLAHDFNNLLVVIQSNAELLESGSKLPVHTLAEEIRVAGEAAAELTGNLLAFAGQQVQEVQSVDVAASLSKIDSLLHRLVHPNVSLEIRNGDELATAQGDPTQFEQVVVNLVLNAQQSMPEGGKITIESSNADVTTAECERHPGASLGAHVRIAVADTGTGMDEETIPRIFEPFYSKREGGTGLGLATVHGMVSQSGGHVRVRSQLGEGTCFEVYLPHSTRAPSPAAPTLRDASPGRREAPVVLLIDDELPVLNSVDRLLTRRGFRVLRAATPEEARIVSEKEPGRIDVLLSDVLMPSTTGPKLAADLVATRPDMKVLFMSGYTEDHLQDHELLRDSVYFIAKPFSSAALSEKIHDILLDA